MKVRITFHIGDEERLAIARSVDRKDWNGKRKATREEIEGVILDGAENSINNCLFDLEQFKKAGSR